MKYDTKAYQIRENSAHGGDCWFLIIAKDLDEAMLQFARELDKYYESGTKHEDYLAKCQDECSIWNIRPLPYLDGRAPVITGNDGIDPPFDELAMLDGRDGWMIYDTPEEKAYWVKFHADLRARHEKDSKGFYVIEESTKRPRWAFIVAVSSEEAVERFAELVFDDWKYYYDTTWAMTECEVWRDKVKIKHVKELDGLPLVVCEGGVGGKIDAPFKEFVSYSKEWDKVYLHQSRAAKVAFDKGRVSA